MPIYLKTYLFACLSAVCLQAEIPGLNVELDIYEEFGVERPLASSIIPEDPAERQRMLSEMMAISMGQAEVPKGKYARSYLHFAAKVGDLLTLMTLLESGWNLDVQDNQGKTPLYVAAYFGRQEIVEELLSAGAQVNLATGKGTTPLAIAVKKGHFEIAKMLRLAGGKILKASEEKKVSDLVEAVRARNQGDTQNLLAQGVDPNMLDGSGRSALVESMEGKAPADELARWLILFSTNLTQENSNGWYPLFYFSAYKKVESVKLLLELGADANHTTSKMPSAISGAASGGSAEIMNLLYAAGATIAEESDVSGPILAAEMNGHKHLARCLRLLRRLQ